MSPLSYSDIWHRLSYLQKLKLNLFLKWDSVVVISKFVLYSDVGRSSGFGNEYPNYGDP